MRISLKLSLVLHAALLVSAMSYGIFVHAQESSGVTINNEKDAAQGITFPVEELGSCANKKSCKAYCDDATHITACVAFAEKHGLMNKNESEQAKKFANALKTEGGPGGCTSAEMCRTFCSTIANLETCIAFADKQGISLKADDPGRKILKYLKAGGQMPGNCTSQESCKTYCEDLSHADECTAFSEKAGLAPVRTDQAKKLAELAKNGETPGKCSSKDTCEAYCRQKENFNECAAFARKAGLISDDEEKTLRATGQKGPGGCDSREACEAYCKDETHREECFTFAKEKGLVKPEAIQQVKEGLVRVRAGLEQTPPEVAACIKTTLGEGVVEKIQSGELTPGSDVGGRIQECFKKFATQAGAGGIWKDASNEVLLCAKQRLGDDYAKIKSGEKMPTPEMADTFRICGQQTRFEKGEGATGQEGERGEGFAPVSNIGNMIRSAPQTVRRCLEEKLGGSVEAFTASGSAAVNPEVRDRMKGCFESFRPENGGGSSGGQMPGGNMAMPEEIKNCVKALLGSLPEGDAATQNPQMNTAMRECAAKLQKERGGSMPEPRATTPGMPVPKSGTGNQNPGSNMPRLNLPQAALDCIQAKATPEVFKRLLEGRQPTPDVEQIIRACMAESVKQNPSEPSAPPRNTPEQCAQVITYAKNPATGVCQLFPTPCAVPPNWTKGCEPTSSNSTQPQQPAQPQPPPGPSFPPPDIIAPQPGAQPYQVPPNPDGGYPHAFNTTPQPTGAPSKLANILSSPIQPFLKFLLGL